jgi:hypothetical protein
MAVAVGLEPVAMIRLVRHRYRQFAPAEQMMSGMGSMSYTAQVQVGASLPFPAVAVAGAAA